MDLENLSIAGGRGLVVDPGRVGDWSQTWTGKRFYPSDPRPEDVSLMDIAFGLGNMARYYGQCRFYSVAEHAVLVSMMVENEQQRKLIAIHDELEKWTPEELAYIAMHHDDVEPYIGDMSRPMKRNVGKDCSWFNIERRVWEKALCPALNLPVKLPAPVIIADTQICVLEKATLHPRSQEWDLPFSMPENIFIRCLEPRAATEAWLRRHAELLGVSSRPLLEMFDVLWRQDQESIDRMRIKQLRAVTANIDTRRVA